MLYDLIQIRRGKEIVVMTDEFAKVRSRMKTLRNSHRKGINGEKVTYRIQETTTNEKFSRKPHDPRIGCDDATYPPKIRKKK